MFLAACVALDHGRNFKTSVRVNILWGREQNPLHASSRDAMCNLSGEGSE
jgi:hypothetical protein